MGQEIEIDTQPPSYNNLVKYYTTKVFVVILGALVLFLLLYISFYFASEPEHGKKSSVLPTPTLQAEKIINSYPLLVFDEIELDDYIPQYPGTVITEALKGKNNNNQIVTDLKFTIPIEPLASPQVMADFFYNKLPEYGWSITEKKECSTVERMLCPEWQDWHTVVATKFEKQLTFDTFARNQYSIKIIEGAKNEVILNPPPEYPEELALPKGTRILKFMWGFNQDSDRIFFLELENLTPEVFFAQAEKNGWNENCAAGSVPGTYSQGCAKANSAYVLNFAAQDISTLKVTIQK